MSAPLSNLIIQIDTFRTRTLYSSLLLVTIIVCGVIIFAAFCCIFVDIVGIVIFVDVVIVDIMMHIGYAFDHMRERSDCVAVGVYLVAFVADDIEYIPPLSLIG